MKLTSPAFEHEFDMDPRFTCEGGDISPPLAWTDPPPGTRSFALLVEDPDAPDPAAPKRIWVHWLVFHIPRTIEQFAEDAAREGLPAGARMGSNDWHEPSYRGPCPPIGRHRYFHRIYALDVERLHGLDRAPPTKAALFEAMRTHVLATAELIGTYRSRRLRMA
jgi:Raf kinase inhibitor-like YbhB/YbcL family protein